MPLPDEDFWQDLMLFIEEGKLIPVVGAELLSVGQGSAAMPLYQWLAQQLIDTQNLPREQLGANFDLNDVVLLYLQKKPSRESLYPRLQTLLRQADLQPGPALLALAGIAPLKLFVSLTFDSLLAQALASVRAPASPLSIAWSPSGELHDLDDASAQHSVVFHLLGKASSTPEFVICDDDMLEFVHVLQDKQRCPVRLFDELKKSHLLILGCGFADWLARFFLRTTRGQEFAQKRRRRDMLVGAESMHDPSLVLFLQNFSQESQVIALSPEHFITELAARWHAAHPTSTAALPEPVLPGLPKRGAVFVSYAKEDHDRVLRLVQGLQQAGLDVWFDREDLYGGSNWPYHIERAIERCALFLPVLSQQSIDPNKGERYFWREWNSAEQRAFGMAAHLVFVIPLLLDDLEPGILPDHLPPSFRRSQAVRLVDGQVDSTVAPQMVQWVQQFHLRQRGVVS